MVFELNARETSNGSTLGRFLGKGLRWDRYVDAKDLIRQRREVTKTERCKILAAVLIKMFNTMPKIGS